MCLPVEMGGLGIRSVVPFNQALLGKWLWRYGHEVSHLWRQVISAKYGEGQEGWRTNVCRRSHGCGLWRSINEGWESFSKHRSAVKDACISEVLWILEGGTVRVWNLRFYRAFEDWELAASYSLLQLIQTRIPRGNRRDTDGLNGMVSLTLGLTTMRFGVLQTLCFLGRVFGNQRFLSTWCSFCGLLHMVGSSLWII